MSDLRTFVAVPLPAAVQSRLFAAAQELAAALPKSGIRWSRKVENLHVTVKFLGPLAEDRVRALGAALEQALAGVPRFQVAVRGMGAFPSPRKATVVWAGVDDAARGQKGRLATLAEVVEGVAARLAMGERERRPFRGHVTVGRCKDGVDARGVLGAVADQSFGVAPVDEVHVYESQLGGGPDNQGSTYVLRCRARLGGATASN